MGGAFGGLVYIADQLGRVVLAGMIGAKQAGLERMRIFRLVIGTLLCSLAAGFITRYAAAHVQRFGFDSSAAQNRVAVVVATIVILLVVLACVLSSALDDQRRY
jgi:hypothetical protein